MQHLQRRACRKSGITIYFINYSELESVTNARGTWASNEASKDVSSGLRCRLGFLQDRERRRCGSSVLWGLLELSSLLLGRLLRSSGSGLSQP